MSNAEKLEQDLAGYERMVAASQQLTETERNALLAWELEHVTGDGKFGTSDWPGWAAVFDRLGH